MQVVEAVGGSFVQVVRIQRPNFDREPLLFFETSRNTIRVDK